MAAQNQPMNRSFAIAMTGASGAVYATRLLQVLAAAGHNLHLMISPSGNAVLQQELNLAIDLENFTPQSAALLGISRSDRLTYHHHSNFLAPVASGSFLTAGMIICPCSGSTLSAIAQGASNNLIQRAADVHLKEGRKLILVPRETPLSLVHLDNMRRACRAGAVILPAMPGWYHGVNSLQDLIDFVVARILDQLGVEHSLMRRWGATN